MSVGDAPVQAASVRVRQTGTGGSAFLCYVCTARARVRKPPHAPPRQDAMRSAPRGGMQNRFGHHKRRRVHEVRVHGAEQIQPAVCAAFACARRHMAFNACAPHGAENCSTVCAPEATAARSARTFALCGVRKQRGSTPALFSCTEDVRRAVTPAGDAQREVRKCNRNGGDCKSLNTTNPTGV